MQRDRARMFHLFHLDTLGTSGCLFVFVGFWFAFLVADGTQDFCKSLQVLFTYKRICDRQGFVLDRLWRKKIHSATHR